MVQPQRPSNLWQADGSLRDVYCSPCTSEHWEGFLRFAEMYEPVYSFEGEIGRIPSKDSIFTNREGSHLLALRVGSAQVNCHFFVPEELELDIDPKEVLDDAQHDRIMEFLFKLAAAIGLPVRLTPENSPNEPFFMVDPGAQSPRRGG
jgi:hypothetical protein